MGHFGKSSGLQCTYVGSLPLQEYFESVDAHFEVGSDNRKDFIRLNSYNLEEHCSVS